ncbi:MAG TPA: DUF4105 domain-containing protein [Gemmatimonadaceae bacterium]|nr:DUF4105 domain-containing protein [Gemmatimonadaceae bacterium]
MPQDAAAPAGANVPQPGDSLVVYLLTMGRGDAVWEKFGHNGILVVDMARHEEVVFNYGMFSFDQPGFLGRFLTGETQYWVEGHTLRSTLEAYRSLNRSVTAQRLDLSPAQRAEMMAFLQRNVLPENKYYRYDYYLDNCSTRVRDAIDHVTGGALRAATADSLAGGTTFRSHTARLLSDAPAEYAGIMIALGEPADVPITRWQEMFLPEQLMLRVRGVQVAGADGATHPLVRDERTLVTSSRPPEPDAVPDHRLPNLAVGAGLALLFVAFGHAVRDRVPTSRALLTGLGVVWSLVSGVVGTVLLLAWTATRHSFWYRNENLLQFNPLSLALVVLIPLAMLRGRATRATGIVAGVVASLSVLGLVMQVLPAFSQVNGEVIALALPVHLAVVAALHAAGRGARRGA